jgi:hypothetical protein
VQAGERTVTGGRRDDAADPVDTDEPADAVGRGARLDDMVDGSVRSRADSDAPQWDVVVGDRFIAAVAVPASDDLLAGLADLAAEPAPGLEHLVSTIPAGPRGSVDSFAVVWWPGDDAGEVTAVVRGSAVVDILSPGGSRRFDARGITPFHLADFTDVTAVRVTAEGAPLWAARLTDAAGSEIGRPRSSFRASEVVWSSRGPITRAVPIAGDGIGDALADTVLSPHNAFAGADTVLVARYRSVDADTVLSRRHRPAWPGEEGDGVAGSGPGDDGDPDAEPIVAESPGEDGDGAVGDGAARHDEHRDPRRAEAGPGAPGLDLAPRFRVGSGETRAVTAPVRIGRNPAPPRIAPGAVELIRVASPTSVVSSTHLELRREGRRLVATDLRSTNGTIVHAPSGTRRMRSGESLVVAPGTSLELGDGTIIEILPAPGGLEG